jgi:hypothetical protein
VDGELRLLFSTDHTIIQMEMQKSTNFFHPTCTADIYIQNALLHEVLNNNFCPSASRSGDFFDKYFIYLFHSSVYMKVIQS